MLRSAIYAVIVDTLVFSARGRSKKAPCTKAHFSHLSLADKVVDAKEDCYYSNNVKWEWKEKSKCKTDSHRNSYPHQLKFKKSFSIRIQQLSLVILSKRVFVALQLWVAAYPYGKKSPVIHCHSCTS
jgi:hypothetical protein